jgi:hypothetical protein
MRTQREMDTIEASSTKQFRQIDPVDWAYHHQAPNKMKNPRSTILDPRLFERYAKAGGPMRESFWAGYRNEPGIRAGVPGSAERRAFLAGRERAKVERGLKET